MTTLTMDALRGYLNCNYGALTGTGDTLGSCYVGYDSLTVSLGICIFFIAYSFIWSVVGQNASKVDQIWSITPMVYVWHFYLHHRLTSEQGHHDRLLLLCGLITYWGVRLTYNFWKKGGYGNFFQHEEDYRWPIIRGKMHPVVFLLFNLSFIASYQNILLWWIAMPAYEVAQGNTDLQIKDIILATLFLMLWLLETTADQQHWTFQQTKHALTSEARAAHADLDIRQGFFTQGFFRFCRHPNYFAEQSMWVVVYLYGAGGVSAFSSHFVTVWGPYEQLLSYGVNWSVLGCLQLIMLFQGSMAFGESISLSKYPLYRSYQESTSQCIPWFPATSNSNRSKKE